MPEVTLLDTQYDKIKAAADGGQKVELEFEIRNYFNMGPVKYYNVIAWLPGTQSQDPAVILLRHRKPGPPAHSRGLLPARRPSHLQNNDHRPHGPSQALGEWSVSC